MESFLEEPRSIPKPTPVIQEVGTVTVPEVSLMFQNARQDHTPLSFNYGKATQSYNAWKLQTGSNNVEDSFAVARANNKENMSMQDVLLSKKQVRFESPTQRTFTQSNRHDYLLQKPVRTDLSSPKRPAVTSKLVPGPFEKMYISNIPNKELDLSFLESQRGSKTQSGLNRYSSNPDTKFVNLHRHLSSNNSASQLHLSNNKQFHFPANKNAQEIAVNSSEYPGNIEPKIKNDTSQVNNSKEGSDKSVLLKQERSVQTDEIKPTGASNPTISDLLKIIKMQNTQLQILQHQVNKLMQLNEQKGPEKNVPQAVQKDVCVETNFCRETQHGSPCGKTAENRKGISVGLMTSFEVSFKPPVSKKSKPRTVLPLDCITNNNVSFHESLRTVTKKQQVRRNGQTPEINTQNLDADTRTWNPTRTNETEYSLGSHEFLDVQEPPESPESSIHIDMHDYDTESDDEDSSLETGWTFYRDILGQVNNILEHRSPESAQTQPANTNIEKKLTDTTLQKIKATAIQKLQSENFLPSRVSKDSSNKTVEPYVLKPNEISFAVKQILMKYLPDDGIANVVTKNEREFITDAESTPNIATFKYMQQYNVVTNGNQCFGGDKTKPKRFTNKADANANSIEQKVLDITTLKQKPKLL